MILSKLTRGMLKRRNDAASQSERIHAVRTMARKDGHSTGYQEGFACAEAKYTKILTVPNDERYLRVFETPDRPRRVVAVPPVMSHEMASFRPKHPDVVPTRTMHTVDFIAVKMGFEIHGRILTWWQWQPTAWTKESR
jgi:hypothetical protein